MPAGVATPALDAAVAASIFITWGAPSAFLGTHMTLQDQQWLDAFLQRLAAVDGVQKDPQVDALIRTRLAQQPDALYLLVQRDLLLEQALDDARAQIASLQAQLANADHASHAAPANDSARQFLAAGLDTQFGRNPTPAANATTSTVTDLSSWGRNASPAANPNPNSNPAIPRVDAPARAGFAERPFGAPRATANWANSAGPATQPAQPQSQGLGGGMLGTMAASAAGAAGGMFLFNGLHNLMGANRDATASPAPASEAAGSKGLLDNNTSASADSSLAHDAGANADVFGSAHDTSDDDGLFDGGNFDDFA